MLFLVFFLVPMVIAVPAKLPRNIYVPNIEDRNLKSIEVIGEPPDALDLSGLGIESFDSKIFDNFTHVKSINLAHNSIRGYNLPDSVFPHLKELEHLSLADNDLEFLGNDWFTELSNLKLLNISYNPIKELYGGSLHGLVKSTNISAYGVSVLHTLAFDNVHTPRPRLEFRACPGGLNWPLHKHNSVILCVRDGIVESLEPYNDSGFGKHCREVPIESFSSVKESKHQLQLTYLGISKFTAGWYRIPVDFFKGLDLSNNNITHITPELLNDLPSNIINIDLSNNKIMDLKKEIIVNDHLRILDLANNAISEIDDKALENTKLSSVNFSKNRLNNTRFVATLPPTLRSLNLESNNIGDILSNVFSCFRELEKIDFSMNNITVISNDSLVGLISLKDLRLEKNQIEKIEMGAFQNLTSLRYLHLANNKLTSLERGVFSGLQLVEQIDLAFNAIKVITSDSFHGLKDTVRTLSLASNKIRILENCTFSHVPLRELWLNNNGITKISSGTFSSKTLKDLHLEHNALGRINGDEFAGLVALEFLDLTGNGIAEIKKGFAKHLGKVEKLVLNDNPFKILENGALFGLTKAINSKVHFFGSHLDIIQGGVFDDL